METERERPGAAGPLPGRSPGPAPGRSPGPPPGAGRGGRDHLWPWLIAAGLVLVLLVNALFIWIAVTGADDVVPSYTEGDR